MFRACVVCGELRRSADVIEIPTIMGGVCYVGDCCQEYLALALYAAGVPANDTLPPPAELPRLELCQLELPV